MPRIQADDEHFDAYMSHAVDVLVTPFDEYLTLTPEDRLSWLLAIPKGDHTVTPRARTGDNSAPKGDHTVTPRVTPQSPNEGK